MKGILIDKGYKVARVEQTETPDMMAERCSNKQTKTTKFDKVVRREICQISCKGALLHTAQMPESGNVFSCFLYALSEKVLIIYLIDQLNICNLKINYILAITKQQS